MSCVPLWKKYKYIYDLPYVERVKLCSILNKNKKWEDLAGRGMQFNMQVIEALRTEEDPVDKLLSLWSDYNHTILELFVLLIRFQQIQAADLLKPFVDEKYYSVSAKKENDLAESLFNSLPHVSFEELTAATGGWRRDQVLGKGGCGVVYKGTWKNTEVAIKKLGRKELTDSESIALEQSFREIKILHSRPHENILPLYAFNLSGPFPCLVYKFMANGSLDDWLMLHDGRSPALTWLQRHDIIKGITRGLQYLHTIGERPLIHGDIKSANILLDKNFEPRIGDFGLVQEKPNEDSPKVKKLQGTRAYLPEDFLRTKILSTKVDVYSYGIVCLEMATGLTAYDSSRSENKLLRDYVSAWSDRNSFDLRDRKAGDKNKQIFYHLLQLGRWCSSKFAKDRPEMEDVFNELDNII
ncbi:GSCOCT00000830001.2-RA-CDS [Cotesia congregata]|uniref:non-specific serine/threonine protein kinase n=1 Tax=Cotesia congregata TaxID=51543 RepID=A0A8J2HKW6_COTCN|nr:GSCOCT00000830001.2-RA-CDS [Cotesia congregata]CAG5095577.1 Serine/threonine-protein kinase pelle.2_Cc [Cotesia congregata]